MIKEYSTEVRGKVHAYRFYPDEAAVIVKAFAAEIIKLQKRIQKINDNPDNEGQVIYSDAIRQLRNLQEDYKEIVNEFSQPRYAKSTN